LATLVPMALSVQYWKLSFRRLQISPLDFAVALYLIVSLVSGLTYLNPANPSAPESFIYGIHYFVLPMCLYYAVKMIDTARQDRLLRLVCFLNVAAIAFGLVLFYLRPGFYHAYLTEKVFGAVQIPMEEWQLFGRLQSYLGSTAVGTIAATTLVLLAVVPLPLKAALVSAPVLIIGSLLTYQRGGLFASLLAGVYLIVKAPKSLIAKVLLPFSMALCLLLSVFLYSDLDESYWIRLKDKYSWASVLEILNWRDRGYAPAIDYIVDFPFGVGLGGTSSAAHGGGFATRGQVVDANFMRILTDLGMVGLLAFGVVLWQAAKTALHKKRRPGGWILLIGLFCLISLGTNTLDSFYVSHCFWLFLGVIDTRDKAVNSDPAA
jgi:hypothetical protein